MPLIKSGNLVAGDFIVTRTGQEELGRKPMDLDTLTSFLGSLTTGTSIAGTQTGKEYRFGGLRSYSGRGRWYAHLKGEPVAVLLSAERKRAEIVIFVAPLLLFVNATDEELGYGRLPQAYYRRYCLPESPEIPNRYEYECHYKALARYIRRVTSGC